MGEEVREALATQEAVLAESKAMAERKRQLEALHGKEEAEKYLAFKQAEAKESEQALKARPSAAGPSQAAGSKDQASGSGK